MKIRSKSGDTVIDLANVRSNLKYGGYGAVGNESTILVLLDALEGALGVSPLDEIKEPMYHNYNNALAKVRKAAGVIEDEVGA